MWQLGRSTCLGVLPFLTVAQRAAGRTLSTLVGTRFITVAPFRPRGISRLAVEDVIEARIREGHALPRQTVVDTETDGDEHRWSSPHEKQSGYRRQTTEWEADSNRGESVPIGGACVPAPNKWPRPGRYFADSSPHGAPFTYEDSSPTIGEMGSGIRALIEFDRSDICPISNLSAMISARIDSVDRNFCMDRCSVATSEFTIEHADLDAAEVTAAIEGTMIPVFVGESHGRYRLIHESERECPCECVGSMGCPVSRYIADTGTLTLEFHAVDYSELQTLIGELRESFPGIDLKRLIRAPVNDPGDDVVVVDRSPLTRRQLEVLRTAHEMGYFTTPRQVNVSDVAEELEIHPSTAAEHLTIAHRKLLEQLL